MQTIPTSYIIHQQTQKEYHEIEGKRILLHLLEEILKVTIVNQNFDEQMENNDNDKE